MIKKSFLTIVCFGLLGLSACSSEKKEMPTQAVDATEETIPSQNELQSVTQVAENDAIESELARTEDADQKEV